MIRISLRQTRPLLLAAALLLGCVMPVVAQAPTPTGGTKVYDPLKLQGDELRTIPQLPRIGAWSMLFGNPRTSTRALGIVFDQPGDAAVYPTTDFLAGATGTIEFRVITEAPLDAADTTQHVLLDSWPNGGQSRFVLSLTGTTLSLVYTNDRNQPQKIEKSVNLAGNPPIHKITIVWDATDMTLLLDGNALGTIEKPQLPGRGPLGIILGSSRDFKNPAMLAICDLRLANIREPNAPANLARMTENLSNEGLTLRMAREYDLRLYPLLEQLRRQKMPQVNFFYAMAFADIGDVDRAMQSVTPIATDVNHPLYVQAIFLRSDLLVAQRDYLRAFEQLQVLAGNADIATSVRAQVKQASVLFEQGSKQDAINLIGDVINRYPDMKEINDAYLMIGLEKFKQGNYQEALNAFSSVGTVGVPPRQSVEIGTPLEIKVADADMSVRVADTGLKVLIASPSGDKEELVLKPAFSRGVYLGSIDVMLGDAKPGDGLLQVQGNDKVKVTYIDRLSDSGADVEHTVSVDLATDGTMVALAQSALDVYREAQELMTMNILDEDWNIIGTLPNTASDFFRNPDNGLLRRKPYRFPRAYIENIKPGQSVYLELSEPDEDRTVKPDTLEVDVVTKNGKSMKVSLTETGAHTGIFAATVKTTLDGQPQAGMLEVTTNDVITARYKDLRPASGTADPVHQARVTIRSVDGQLACGLDLPDPNTKQKLFVRTHRLPSNGTASVQLTDRDQDISDAVDKVTIKARTAAGEVPVTLQETGTHTGIFSGKLTLSTDPAAPATALKVKQGEMVTLVYRDDENTTGKPQDIEFAIKVNMPENTIISFQRQVVEQPKIDPDQKGMAVPPPKVTWEPATVFIPGYVYRVTLVDPDLLPSNAGGIGTKLKLLSANKAAVEVPLQGGLDDKEKQIVFTGNFYVRLGDATSPSFAYLTQTGAVVRMSDDEGMEENLWSLPAINVQGMDAVQVIYTEPLTSDGRRNIPTTLSLKVVADAEIELMNARGNVIEILKPGMPFDVQIEDANGDLTPKRDTIKVTFTSSIGDQLLAELTETDVHSGMFVATIPTVYGATPLKNNSIEVPFSGTISIAYRDTDTIAGTPVDRSTELPTRPMAEAEGVLLTKVYDDPKFEMETLVRLGESLYAVGAAELAAANLPKGAPRTNAKLQESARLMQQVADRFPASSYVVECLFLTGKVRREERNYKEAELLFNRVIKDYPDSDFVPQALYQLVMMYYDQNDIEKATDAAMQLVYGFPKNPLVADGTMQIAEYYYSVTKDYLTAAHVYKRILERFPDNPKADLIFYRIASSYYKAGAAGDNAAMEQAIRYFLDFVEMYKDHELADDAYYWAGRSYEKLNKMQKAYTMYTKVVQDYPNGDTLTVAIRKRNELKEMNPNIDVEPL